MRILVTGGAGYIGSHTCVELLNEGFEVVIMDNLSNSSPKAVERIKEITGKDVAFYETDMLDREGVRALFDMEKIDAVIHFAGLKAVGESVSKPIEYYHNNIAGTLNLCYEMRDHGVKNIIFSSSATVYGDPAEIPITENCPKGVCTNPYGWTKHMQEQILTDIHTSDPEWNVVLLRYFNPIGAHPSGRIGEDPKGIPNNLLPYVAQVAIGKLPEVGVFGNDYDTPDGTGVRDYIHVVDLARGHVKAMVKLAPGTGVSVFNLGTGNGYSVLDVIRAFGKACGHEIPYSIKPRRPGDIATCYSSPEKAKAELGWEAEYDLDDMCRDSWNWQSKNPDGYRTESE
ncbi:MAG: UDP-glucose 4-epimerase GalE [Eubacterium sp.]|nr:UDP-glucose 4-epimerase GalE [Eubacterium sp.]